MKPKRVIPMAFMPVMLTPGLCQAGQEGPASDEQSREQVVQAVREASREMASGASRVNSAWELRDGAGAFSMRFRGQIQFRAYADVRDADDHDGDGAGEDDFESGFQTRRLKLFLDGHVFDPALTYSIVGAVNRATGDLGLENALARYTWESGLTLQAGQFKPPFLREWLVASASQLVIERGVIHDAFTLEFVQGVLAGIEPKDGAWRAALAFTDGAASRNSEFDSPKSATASGLLNRPTLGESDYAVTGRFEMMPAGEWSRFRDFTSGEGEDFALLFGVAGHVEGGDRSTSAFSEGAYVSASWTGDVSLEGDGWNLFFGAAGTYADVHDPTSGPANSHDFGFIGQGGFMIPGTKFEPYARYEVLFADPDRRGTQSPDAFHYVTAGFNWYLFGHAAKFSADAVLALDEADPLARTRTGAGLLGDDDPGELVFRVQWQLLF